MKRAVKYLAFLLIIIIAALLIVNAASLRRLHEMIETIKAVPDMIVLYVTIASLIMMFFVLEAQRAYNFLIDKHPNPYQTFWNFKYKLKFLNGWRSERLSKIVYLMIMPVFVSMLLLFVKRRAHEFTLTHFIVDLIAASLVFPSIAAIFYIQEFYLPKFQSRTSAILYIILMMLLVLLSLYYVYFSDYGIYSF